CRNSLCLRRPVVLLELLVRLRQRRRNFFTHSVLLASAEAFAQAPHRQRSLSGYCSYSFNLRLYFAALAPRRAVFWCDVAQADGNGRAGVFSIRAESAADKSAADGCFPANSAAFSNRVPGFDLDSNHSGCPLPPCSSHPALRNGSSDHHYPLARF